MIPRCKARASGARHAGGLSGPSEVGKRGILRNAGGISGVRSQEVVSAMNRVSRRLWALIALGAVLVSTAHAQSPKGLWVLQEPDRVVEYDITTFAARRTLTVPRRLLEHPEYLSINATGQMMFLPPEALEWGTGEMATAGDRAWFWDGRQAREWKLAGPTTPGDSASRQTVTETALQWFLSRGGQSLFEFENRFEKVVDADEPGRERFVRNTARVWRTDLAGGRLETTITLPSSESCECTTGTCSESCPEWMFWAPDGVVDGFFLVTRMTPGQIGSRFHESLLYQRPGAKWQATKLPQPVERPLTASAKGEVLVAAVDDGGCCGWVNEGNDQTLVWSHGRSSVLFDETARYRNRNYDVSFYAADARLAPGNALVAQTIITTTPTGRDIRLSSDGKADADELARVSKAITELPAVEVMPLASPARPAANIRHATLVGWTSDRELLVAQDGHLVLYDARGNKVKDTAIRVRSAADAFLR